MANLILKDGSVETEYGWYECPECNSALYSGGPFFHFRGCPRRAANQEYDGLIYHVGPNCPEYGEAVDDLKAAAFNLGYEAHPENKHLFGDSSQVAEWYISGWEAAERHQDPWVCAVCATDFENEADLLAHQFNSSCGAELENV